MQPGRVILNRAWFLQNPLFGGHGAVGAYQPVKKIAVAVATAYGEGSFDVRGNSKYPGHADIFAAIGASQTRGAAMQPSADVEAEPPANGPALGQRSYPPASTTSWRGVSAPLGSCYGQMYLEHTFF